MGNIAKAAVRSSGVTSPVPSDSEGTSGKSRSPALDASCRTGRDPNRCCSAVAARLFDSMRAARSVSASGVSPVALRGAHSSGPCGRMFTSPSRTDTGEKPCSSAAAKSSGLNADPGCRRLRAARLNCDWRKSRPPTSARMSPLRGSMTTSAACRLRLVEAPQSVGHGTLGHLLQFRHERRPDLPVRRMIAAELDRETAGAGIPSHSRPADRSCPGTGAIRMRAARAARSSVSVMNPSSRMRVRTTWLRAIAPSRLVHGESADGARASPATSAHSARFRVFAGRPNRCRDIVSTPYTPALR